MTATTNRSLKVDDESGLLEVAYQTGKSVMDLSLADLIATEDLQPVDEIKAAEALGAYYEANERQRKGASDQRKARKNLDKLDLEEGVYGPWRLLWEPNEDREVLDEEAITALYRRLNMEVPKVKKPVNPSLKVVKA